MAGCDGAPVIPAMCGSTNRKILTGLLGYKAMPFFKIINAGLVEWLKW
jgi:hypothetical protein